MTVCRNCARRAVRSWPRHVLVGMPDVFHVRFEVCDQEGISVVHIDLRFSLAEQRVVAAHVGLVPVRVEG